MSSAGEMFMTEDVRYWLKERFPDLQFSEMIYSPWIDDIWNQSELPDAVTVDLLDKTGKCITTAKIEIKFGQQTGMDERHCIKAEIRCVTFIS